VVRSQVPLTRQARDAACNRGHKLPYFMAATSFNLGSQADAIVLAFPFFMIVFALESAITKTSAPAGYFGKL
jgi:hypothetical protein